MITPENSKSQSASELIPPQLAKEIEQALEMMRRVRIAHLAQGKGEVIYPPGNKYELPEPLVYPVSPSSDLE